MPGATLCAVTAPALAGALLRGCRARVPPTGGPLLNLVIERDDQLHRALVAAGASVLFTLTQLGASLARGPG